MILDIIKRSVFLESLFIILVSCNNINTDTNIYGNWKGFQFDHEFSFIFKSDHTCVLEIFDKQKNKHKIINGNYELNFSKTPISLSINNIPQLNHPLCTIIEFISDDSIRIAQFSPQWRLRPITFNNNTTMVLGLMGDDE